MSKASRVQINNSRQARLAGCDFFMLVFLKSLFEIQAIVRAKGLEQCDALGHCCNMESLERTRAKHCM